MKGEIIKKDETVKNDEVIQFFIPELPTTPGWVVLDHKKRDAILLHTSRLLELQQVEGYAKFAGLAHLALIALTLEGENMQLKSYLRNPFPNDDKKTIERKALAINRFAASAPIAFLEEVTKMDLSGLSEFRRLSNAAWGDITNAMGKVKIRPISTRGGAKKYLAELEANISTDRKERRKGGRMQGDEMYATKAAALALIRCMRSSRLEKSTEKIQFLKRVNGWAMQAMAIPGTLTAVKLSLPDGFNTRRGRPKGSKTKRKEGA